MPDTPKTEKFFSKPLIIIFVTVLIDLIGFGIVIPVLPYYVESPEFGATPLILGVLVASYSVMQFIFSPILGGLSDKYGRRPVLFFSLLGTAAGFFIVGGAWTIWMIFAGRILDGVTGGNISTAQAYIADVTTRKNRAKGMGLIGAAFGLGFVLGPAIGGVLSRWGAHVPFLFAGGLALANAIGVYFYLPESLPKEKRVAHAPGGNRLLQIFDSLSDARFRSLSILYFLIITAFSIMTTSFALYTQARFGYDAEQNGWLFAYIGIIAVLMQGGIFGRLAHAIGESALVVIGSLMLAASLFLVPYVGPQWGGLVGLLAGMAFFAVGNSLCSPAIQSLASKAAGEHEQGKALGIMQSGASLARAVGPFIAGILLNTAAGKVSDHSLTVTFWTAAGIMFVAFVGAIVFARNAPEAEAAAA
ncbi:MAG TPA: MFS transporter [Pyrinomonadaceae bacterium]|nr:MFS transporter [Pyrinomonadaceae bacterium]